MTLPTLARARRRLHRASRLAAADRLGPARQLAERACMALRDGATRRAGGLDELAAALTVLADLHLAAGEPAAARPVLDELVELRITDATSPTGSALVDDRLADALTRRGDVLRLLAEHDAAEQDLAAARRTARYPVCRAGARNASGILAKDRGRYAEADEHYRAAVELVEQEQGPDSPDLASLMHNLAGLHHAQGRYRDGEPYARRAVRLREASTGPESVELAGDLAVLGALLAGQHRLDEAERVFDRAVSLWTRRRGADHYEVAVLLHHLAAIAAERGQHQLASEHAAQALAIKRRVLGDTHPETRRLAVFAARFPALRSTS